ncbi:rhp16, partial [Symbiodinium pilosum]
APTTPKKRQRGKGSGDVAPSPKETPAPVSMPRAEARSSKSSQDSSAVGWGASLKAKQPGKAIELSLSDDSDLELLHEEGAQKNGLAWTGCPATASSPSKPTKGKAQRTEEQATSAQQPRES